MTSCDYLGLRFDFLTMTAVENRLRARTDADDFAYVVTPNVDHVVRLHALPDADRPVVDAAYRRAWLSLCDSRILARLARVDGLRLPVVPGSDLTAAVLLRIAAPGDRIAIVGGDAETLPALRSLRDDLTFVQHVPPMGLRTDAGARAVAARFVADAGARFTFLAIGSPQQELVAALVADLAPDARGTALCVGASIDFLTGRARRAPGWMQRAHLEWLHRLASEPRRMWRRYLVEGPRILAIRRRHRPR